MNFVFVDRPPTDREVEKLRLLLSTYQDGTGMIQTGKGMHLTLPGWRDFERASALTFDGRAVESKFFVDVIFPLTTNPDTFYGIDCKMRSELRSVDAHGKIYVEVTNAARLFWSHLYTRGITEANYRTKPELAGNSLIEAVELLKKNSSLSYPEGPILTDKSYYLVLLWNNGGVYQLFQLALALPNPGNLRWTCHVSKRRDGTETTRLAGENSDGVLYEWYGDSGGQFKFYPLKETAIWSSKRFQLEALKENVELGIMAKAQAYFPDLWKEVTEI